MTLGDEVQKRYPRLIRAMRQAGLLTESEAIGALVDYKFFGVRDGFGSEAIAHLGGPLTAIQWALRSRHRLSRMPAEPHRNTST